MRPRDGTRPRAARLAVAAIFFLNGAAGASWFVRIPAVQERLALSPGVLGFTLLAMPIGAVVAMPLAGWLVARIGSRPVTRASTVAFCAGIALPGLAPTTPWLALALFGLGAANGAMDVAMNAQGIAVERRYRRPIMSTFHGLFSIGGMVGAALGGLVAAAGVDVAPNLVGAALVFGLAGLVASRWLLPAHVDSVASGSGGLMRPTPVLLGLGAVGFCAMVGEGAMSDWSALYLRSSLAAHPGVAALGYAVFSATMAVGRLVGDWLTERLGPVALLRMGGLLAAGGLLGALVSASPPGAIAGFAVVGVGLSIASPIVYSAAGRLPGIPPGPGIATVTTTGYLGFMLGPPAIGLTAEVVTLRGALLIVVALSLAVSALAGVVGQARQHGSVVEDDADRETAPPDLLSDLR